MSKDNRKWLAAVVHALYCERTGIQNKVSELRNKLKSILEKYMTLVKILEVQNRKLIDEIETKPFMSYKYEMQELSFMISSLPKQISIV